MFIGRENELADLNDMYNQNKFQLFVLYGRRRVGKTTLINEFCKNKDAIFYSAEQSNNKLNLEKFSGQVFQFYGENTLEPFSSWANARPAARPRPRSDRRQCKGPAGSAEELTKKPESAQLSGFFSFLGIGMGMPLATYFLPTAAKSMKKNAARNRMVSGLPPRAPHVAGCWGEPHTFGRAMQGA